MKISLYRGGLLGRLRRDTARCIYIFHHMRLTFPPVSKTLRAMTFVTRSSSISDLHRLLYEVDVTILNIGYR